MTDSAENIIEIIGLPPWSGTRPDHPARRNPSHINGLDDDRRAAFILPSYGRPCPLQPPQHLQCEWPRHATKKCDPVHHGALESARCTNRLPDCDVMAKISTMDRLVELRSGCALDDNRSSLGMLSARAIKIGARVHDCGSVPATMAPSARSPPTSGASTATKACVSSGSSQPVARCSSYRPGPAL